MASEDPRRVVGPLGPKSGRRSSRVPERLVFAVDLLDLQPEDRIVEIGGGTGVAAELICARLRGGRLLGIDRSAKATASAAQRNAESVRAGLAEFQTLALEDVDPAELGRFDKIVAINVNVFWVGPAQAELDIIANLLQPDGQLVLVYEPPDAGKASPVATVLTDHLEQAGFRRCRTDVRAAGDATLVAVIASPPLWVVPASRPKVAGELQAVAT